MSLSHEGELKEEEILELFAPSGILSQAFKGYQPRVQQQEMARCVVRAYREENIALIEAGTGTGKSMAYLIPAIAQAVKRGERTVISTHTITLQQQLIEKDIPSLIRALKADVKAVLIKGMSNYLCLRKLEDAKEELQQMPLGEARELEKLAVWSESTKDGSKSDLNVLPSAATWERVGMEMDACNRANCPHFKRCFFFRARREAEDAQLLVVNHHLLLADILLRSEEASEGGILPEYSALILDEAHNLEEIATEAFAIKISRLELLRQMGRLATETRSEAARGKLPQLRMKIEEAFLKQEKPEGAASIWSKLEIDLPAERRRLATEINEAFQILVHFLEKIAGNNAGTKEQKLRLKEEHFQHPLWSEQVQPATEKLVELLRQYVQSLRSLEGDISRLKNERLDERTRSLRLDIQAIAGRLELCSNSLSDFSFGKLQTTVVKWIEARHSYGFVNLSLNAAQLDISALLAEHLFTSIPTIILTSATLATNQNFDFIRRRLGLVEPLLQYKPVSEAIYDSPFDYQQQALLLVPNDIPAPTERSFTQIAAERIWDVIEASRGNAFVLFTSFQMLEECHKALALQLQEGGYATLKQGDEDRLLLLERFKKTPSAVLFGTDSFWEGVDVVGDALRCVIITKLPFKVPTEPMIEARLEALTASGEDPFTQYAIPQAIVKFKQGFGRLIRNSGDRGCVVCLDSRLIRKGYGKFFLNSLPPCPKIFESRDALRDKMVQFYGA